MVPPTSAIPDQVDVAIVGGGPVGMMSALELLANGISAVVLEAAVERDQRLRARVINAQSVALLERRGLTGDLTPSEPRTIVNFAGIDRVDLSLVEVDHPYALFVRQQTVEAALEARLASCGVPIRRGVRATSFRAGSDDVEVEYEAGGRVGKVRARYLIGCDGGRSLVRRTLGIPFDGSPPTLVAYQGLMDLLVDPPYATGWHRTILGTFVVGPGRRFTLIDINGDADARVHEAEIAQDFRAALSRVLGSQVDVTGIESLTRFTDNTRVARRFRAGRVFLAGDAAHVQPPFAGQGLNMGLQDAANLGWKLSHVLEGIAPPELLDTYDAERRAVAIKTVGLALGQSALWRTDPQTEALRGILDRVLDDPGGNRAFGTLIAGAANRYAGDDCCECTGRYARDEPLIRRDVATSLVALQRENPACFILILGTEASASGRLHETGALDTCIAARARTDDLHAKRVRLVRPDGYVADCIESADAITSVYAGVLARHRAVPDDQDVLAFRPTASVGGDPRYVKEM